MREKMIEILSVPIYPHELADPTEVVADYLLDNDVVPVVRCKNCRESDPCDVSRGRVWCKRMCRYMDESGYCSEGNADETLQQLS